jgi:AcrR family transcriptional regulator
MLLRSDQRQRPRLHQAMIDLCFEVGFAQITVTDLCRRAGIERAEFERRYVDLDECFFEAYEMEVRRFTRLMAAARACPGSWRDRLRATAYALLSFLRDDERVTNFVAVEVRAASERAQLLFGQGIEPLFDLIDEGRDEPGASPSLTRATAEQVGGGIFHQIYGAVGQGQSLAPGSRIIPEMMYAAVLPYLGPEVAVEELRIPPPPAPEF